MAAGANRPTALAIESGLAWLVRHQSEDGRWDADAFAAEQPAGETDVGKGLAVHDIGVTGLARLALLGDGNTLNCGPHHANVQHAIEWLRQ